MDARMKNIRKSLFLWILGVGIREHQWGWDFGFYGARRHRNTQLKGILLCKRGKFFLGTRFILIYPFHKKNSHRISNILYEFFIIIMIAFQTNVRFADQDYDIHALFLYILLILVPLIRGQYLIVYIRPMVLV